MQSNEPNQPTQPRQVFIRLTCIPAHATEAETLALIQSAYEATQADATLVALDKFDDLQVEPEPAPSLGEDLRHAFEETV